jgi:hypothetical protein
MTMNLSAGDIGYVKWNFGRYIKNGSNIHQLRRSQHFEDFEVGIASPTGSHIRHRRWRLKRRT